MAGEIEITDEMVAQEVIRLTSGAMNEGAARRFASDLRSKALAGEIEVNYHAKFDEFVNEHIRPLLPRNNVRKLGKRGSGKAPKVRANRWHPFIATPAYDDRVLTGYAQSILQTAYACPLFDVMLSGVIMNNGAFIDLARNIMVRRFLEDFPDCTHLFFLDADLSWSPNAFIGMVRHDLPVVAGVYPRRQEDEDYPIRFAEYPEGGGLWVEDIDGFDFWMAERVPTGFLCIRRDIVQEMAAECDLLDIHGQPSPVPELFKTSYDPTNVRFEGSKKFVGEDYTFCDKYVAKYNRMIHVWPDIDFVHGSSQVGRAGNLLNWVGEDLERQKAEGAEVGAVRAGEKVQVPE